MALRIDPRVDFACKRMLGSPDHPDVTIHFLNSLLTLEAPIVGIEILNPLVGKDRSEDKVIVLDILARDSHGRLFNIEMQTRLPLSFANRLLLYNCKNYTRQVREGDGYEELRPAISICLLDRRMFFQPSEANRHHHSFRLRCDQNAELVLTNDLEFHIFELPKYQPSSDNIGQLPADEKWLYLFTRAAEMDQEVLAELLEEPPYREALGVLQMISKSPEDLQYYEDRLKFLRDERGKLLAAQEEGREEGLKEGREEGREEGRKEGERLGLEKGERLGLEKGEVIGQICVFQEILDETITAREQLAKLSIDELAAQLADLKQRFRDQLG